MDIHHLNPDITDAANAAPSGPLAGRMGDRARWRLAMLEELAEIGMEVARAIGRQVVEAVQYAEPGSAPSDAVVKAEAALKSAGRTVRQTLALHAKFEKQMQEQGGEKNESAFHAHRDDRLAKAKPGYHDRRKTAVRRSVVRMLRVTADPSDAEDLLRDLRERLDEFEDYADYVHEPVSALVAAICRIMGIAPDWRLLANEPWAIEEMRTKPPGSPYADWDSDCDEPGADRERGPP